jgi:hypothetical protein
MGDVGLTGPTDAADAERQLLAAIDLGQLTAEHAPAGHPVFAAIARAEADLAQVQEDDSIIGPALVPGTRTYAEISGAIDGITAAAADVRNDPNSPLPPTLWSLPAAAIPWLPIGFIGAGLAVAWWLFRSMPQRSGR